MKEQITYDIFDKIDIRLGTVISVKKNEKARKPSLVIEVDFGEEIGIRFRPSYFPFTEPSAEVDILSNEGKWLEILGSGMVDPEVFKSVNIDPDIWHGFAFGMGIERICMLKYGIDDIRLLYQGDMRFLEQF